VERFALNHLRTWKNSPNRKPLIIRGARQVGKSYLARAFAEEAFEGIAEVNFERQPDVASLFASNDPAKILPLLELRLNCPIRPGRTLLFLDEIQAAPTVITALRYFFEAMPDLHVVAAGSLLEFALADLCAPMPVGRIEFLHLGPMQFEEFLRASGGERLADFLAGFHPGDEIPMSIHDSFMGPFREFLVVGGMPAVVSAFLPNRSFRDADEAKVSLLSTFENDFGKYGGRVPHRRIGRLFTRLPALVGQRFKYVNVDRDERSGELARALDLLCLARVAYRVCHTAANGIPLAAETRDNVFRMLFLDSGLVASALGLTGLDVVQERNLLGIRSGALCEQVVGQHLLNSHPFYREPELHFWTREKTGSSAAVDYVIAEGPEIVPIEVKAGRTGTLKSLHVFLREKERAFGIRLNSDVPSLLDAKTSFPGGADVPFRLLSLPLYLVGQVRRLSRECLNLPAM
jgi:predicted AAA+ superfamily ATPase